MAEISAEEDLKESHEVFASEVVRELNTFYSIHVDLAATPDKVKYLTGGILGGIITVSHLLRKENYEIFDRLRVVLRKEDYFHECCMLFPTEKTDRFFFNFLKRVSWIYEMALYCYWNNHDYISTARNCIAQFQEKEFFKSAGSWERLDRIGSFLNRWSKKLRPVIVHQIRQRFLVISTTRDEMVDTRREEKEEKFESNDKDSREILISDMSYPERSEIIKSALKVLLADEIQITDVKDLGSIEDEIKSIMRYLINFLPHEITKHYKEPSEDSKNQNIGAESLNTQTSSTRCETPASSFYERLEEEKASSLSEKLSSEAKQEELGSVVEETKACFQDSPESTEENKTDYSILVGDLEVSPSSTSEKSEQLSGDENKIPSSGDLHQISDKTTSEYCLYSAEPATYTPNSLDNADYIKSLEYDLYVKATRYIKNPSGYYDIDDTEPYSAINSRTDEGDYGAARNNVSTSENNDYLTMNIKCENKSEVKCNLPVSIPSGSSTAASFTTKRDSDSSSETNNEEQLTSTKSVQSSTSEAVEKPNANTQQRKTRRLKKKGKSKK